MDFMQIQAYAGFWLGAVVMISIHNMFVSFFLYKARQTNVSNILKIIFNFGNALRLGAAWGNFMTPAIATLLQCTAIAYVTAVGNVLVRLSLIAFLLWRLKQIHQNRLDDWVCTILFTLRAGFGVAQLGLQRPTTHAYPDENIVVCDPNEITSIYYVGAGIAVEFIADVYVTVRLIQILRQANRNAAQIASNIGQKSKRTLFTAVIYWNFLRLFVSFVFHATPIINKLVEDGYNEVLMSTLLPIINIILSYVITVDAEIVRVIEGRDKKKSSSAGTEKSMIQSPRTPRTPPHYSSDLPKYSASSSDQSCSQIGEDKLVVVSMKRLSFFEWANVVVGKRIHRDNDNEIEEEDDDVEEIIDGPSKEYKEESKREFNEEPIEESQDRRDSNFSGSTLDEDPSIVIHH